MKLITFTGAMGSGKSTAVEILRNWRPNKTGFSNVKFAAPLYEIQEFIYNKISPAYKRPDSFIKDRKLLQWLGTEWGRGHISDSLWVDLWKAKAGDTSYCWTHHGMDCYVASDDVRFDNEAEAVHSLGGYIIKLTSDKNTDRITTANGIVNHSSETGINEKYVDFTITNDDSIEEFETKLKQVFEQIVQNYKRSNKNGI